MTWEGLSPPYRTIVADPPWQSYGSASAFGARGRGTGPGKPLIDAQPETQYETMTGVAVAALPIEELVDRNAHLYLWATCSNMREALDVVDAWGFTYKTMLTWVKNSHGLGLGAYFRMQTEHVLFAIRGSLPTLVNDQPNIFEAPRSGHSVKPGAFGDLVERSSPGPYVELFARQPRLGWDSWGRGYEGVA